MSPKPPILAFDAHLSLPRRCGAGAGRVGGFVGGPLKHTLSIESTFTIRE